MTLPPPLLLLSLPAAPPAPSIALRTLKLNAAELSLRHVLPTGQTFTWEQVSANAYLGTLDNFILFLKQDDDAGDAGAGGPGLGAGAGSLRAACLNDPASPDWEPLLLDYFQSATRLEPLYETWSLADERLRRIGACLPGIRVVRQDPVECLFSFICSSNNNIKRIHLMISRLREKYGTYLGTVEFEADADFDGFGSPKSPATPRTPRTPRTPETPATPDVFSASGASALLDGATPEAPEVPASPATAATPGGTTRHTRRVYAFPTVEQLCVATEEELRALGFGYRAKYIVKSAELLRAKGGREYLLGLRASGRAEAKAALLEFAGVGPKVADCVALFCLDQTDCIPVDVHVWRIACRDYDEDGSLARAKSLTPAVYEKVGDKFRARFGDFAGWAHSLLFAAELPKLRKELPEDLVEEQLRFLEAEREEKREAREAKERKRQRIKEEGSEGGDGGSGAKATKATKATKAEL